MRKTDRKTDNAVCKVLTEVCDIAQDKQDGFQWLTHFANYSRFPASLAVVCVYETNEQLAHADRDELRGLIRDKLASIDIDIKDIRKHVEFDTEENCTRENRGKWHERFA